MNSMTKLVSEASLGLALGIGIAEPLVVPEGNPAQVALVHGSQDAEKPAPPALVSLETNRAERRKLKLLRVDLESIRQDQVSDINLRLDAVRRQIAEHRKLVQNGRT